MCFFPSRALSTDTQRMICGGGIFPLSRRQYRGHNLTPIPASPSPRKADSQRQRCVSGVVGDRRSSWSDLVMPRRRRARCSGRSYFRRKRGRRPLWRLSSRGSRSSEGYFARDAVCVLFDLFFRHAQGIAVARRRNSRQGLMALTRILRSLRVAGEGAREGPHGGLWMPLTR